MPILILGLVIFFAAHLLPTQVGLRAGLRDRFGAKPYELGFIVVSLVGLILIGQGYGQLQGTPSKNPVLWVAPVWTKHLLWLLMLPALILLAASVIPSRIRDLVRHPMLLSTKIWAAGHLLANGSLAAVLLFGSFLAWAVVDLISVKKRGAMGPLKDRKGSIRGDVAAVTLGVAAYAFMMFGGHAWLIGVALLPSYSFAP